MTTNFEITNGPSVEAIFAALRWKHLDEKISTVEFTAGGKITITVKIFSLASVGDCGENWVAKVCGYLGNSEKKYGNIYYNSGRRKGTLTVLPTKN